ncbi:MAG: hypothetical protein RDU20_13705 [Desulfomonilaceae bacterium]|nr:hypothetical protein [Desulfomonilaceae bacterium]
MIDPKMVHKRSRGIVPIVGAIVVCLALAAAVCYVVLAPFPIHMAHAVTDRVNSPMDSTAGSQIGPDAGGTEQSSAMRVERLEEVLASIETRMHLLEEILPAMKATGKMAEVRSYDNKMMTRELLRYVRIMVIVLIAIAVGFPLIIWLLSRKRILGLSGLSSEVAATVLLVEERQAKLANILKDIQGEIDYLHTMSVPDLKDLIQKAESYLKQNEKDLEKAGIARNKTQPPQ